MGKRDNGGLISQRSPHKYRHNTGTVLEAMWWGRGVNFLSTRLLRQIKPPLYTVPVYYITFIHAWIVSVLPGDGQTFLIMGHIQNNMSSQIVINV